MGVKYKRVLLKLSGEAIEEKPKPKNEENEQPKEVTEKDPPKKLNIIDFDFLNTVAEVIKKCVEEGTQIAVMIGAGNIWRGGRQGGKMNRARADHMGMLATTINSLALQDNLEAIGVDAVTMTSVAMETFADQYSSRKAVKALDEGKVVILGGGSGLPYFSTDTAAVLRAAEIEADVVLMAKNIDGIYEDDPKKNEKAKRFDEITYKEMIDRNLLAYDLTATIFCKENNIKTYAFGLKDPMNIYRVITGENVGTETHN